MTLSSVVLTASSDMWTEESKRILMDNRKKRNIPKDYLGNLECTIKLRNSTVEALKEMASGNNPLTYDQVITRLITSYKERENAKKI